MANPEHLAKLKEGVKAWNAWRSEHPEVKVDLEDTDLSGLDLRSADLGGADLGGTKLVRAKLNSADLSRANLGSARLNEADLRWAYLLEANLSAYLQGANLSGADLRRAKLISAQLKEANLSDADLGWVLFSSTELAGSDMTNASIDHTVFADADLSAVKGLETVRPRGPSTLGIDTIYRSKGRIPESFLRGCGIPDGFITYAKSLTANPIQFYSCFISYSTKDQDFADRLYADLQNKGVRCWFAPHDVQSGRKLHEQIDEAIRLHDKLLLILSPHSMESEWVKTEIAKARKREVRDKRRVLFPIRLAPFETLRDWECFDADTGKDSAREIREYFIPDFSNWKDHDSYQEAFDRLIGDLKASDSRTK
ncbi:MAG: toll/interleukin-1 receptor domain-containing protein [Candidatus Sulfotelmatobacter sp.]